MGHPKEVEEDAPGEEGGDACFECGADNVRVIDEAEDADDGGVQQVLEWWMDEGKVAVGHLAQAEAVAAVEEVAEVPDGCDVGVLP